MQKLFLLDAYALIYRAYYAFIKNPRINSKGMNTSAIMGFVNTLEEVVKSEQPTHLAVAFDPSGPTFRHEAYPEYKAQREATPEAIRVAVPEIKRILAAYHIPILEVEGFEADDVIGTVATQLASEQIHVYMMTPDKDYAQLVTPHITMYRPSLGNKEAERLGPQEVMDKYGLTDCRQVIDLLGLMGDASDNIPGCPGVGEKTAVKLIGQFGSIEQLLQRTDELKGALKQKVEENKEQIKQSKWLATIKTDVPMQADLDSMVLSEPNIDELKTIYEKLEFRMLLKRFEGQTKKTGEAKPAVDNDGYAGDLFSISEPTATYVAEQDAPADSDKRTMADLAPRYHLADTPEAILKMVETLAAYPTLCLDTETTSTEAMRAKLVGMSFCAKAGEAWYVPYTPEFLELLRPLYENQETLKVGQNLKYDLTVLKNHGVELGGKMFDTMLAHYLVSPELHHGMDYLAEIYLNYRTIHIEELIGPKGKKQKNMADLSPADIKDYACEDADITLQLKEKLEAELKEKGCDELFRTVEMPLMPVLARMEHNGVCIDADSLKQTSIEFTAMQNAIEKEVHKLAGMEFNVSSPKQVGEVLFDHLHLNDKAKKTKTGSYATGEDILLSLQGKHPIVEKILEYRGLKKLLSTYIDALPLLVNPDTGHIHTSFNQAVAQTGRLSSSNPNLQNIPVRDALGKEVRKVFIPEPGEVFFSADYSQIELRIMAHLSSDENLIEAFLEGHDIHAATAAKIFHKDISEVTSDERRRAKTANFGIIYGISAFGLAERLGCSRYEARNLIDGYFATYPKVKAYMDKSIQMARELGYTETVFHRRLSLPDINSRNAVVRGYAERNAINAPIQGTAADIIKIAMIRVDKRMREEGVKSKMILQVHDELNFSVPQEEKELMQRLVTEEMQQAACLRVPLVADSGWGKNWLEAH
ncbi:MAG: DNA polymerase I [Bacteroidaceae bacterium]|nr:DNA polymerase I [Bacteroidaceae bacterium]